MAQAVVETYRAPVLRLLVEQGPPLGKKEFLETVVGAAVWDGELDAGTAAWLRDVAAGRRTAAAKGTGAGAALEVRLWLALRLR